MFKTPLSKGDGIDLLVRTTGGQKESKTKLHYKNGREAKNGDRIVNPGLGRAGILYNAQPQSTSFNGRMASVSDNDAYVTIGECLHMDDIAASANTLEDISKLPPPPSATTN